MSRLVLDSGPLYAAADLDHPDHDACTRILNGPSESLILPALVLTEVFAELHQRLGPHDEVLFCDRLTDGRLTVAPPEQDDWPRVAELVWGYTHLPLDAVDASVVTTAERLEAAAVATLDQERFAAVGGFPVLP